MRFWRVLLFSSWFWFINSEIFHSPGAGGKSKKSVFWKSSHRPCLASKYQDTWGKNKLAFKPVLNWCQRLASMGDLCQSFYNLLVLSYEIQQNPVNSDYYNIFVSGILLFKYQKNQTGHLGNQVEKNTKWISYICLYPMTLRQKYDLFQSSIKALLSCEQVDPNISFS